MTSVYEATISLSHISTSLRARNACSITDAVKKAKANLRYITRGDAAHAVDLLGYHRGTHFFGNNENDRNALRQIAYEAIEQRAKKHTQKNGVRLADKIIVSLPNDATDEQHRRMICSVLEDLGTDSEAHLFAALHRDRAGNPHAHILAVDGLESSQAARERRPGAKRIRRKEHLQLNAGGNRKAFRERVAAHINRISESENCKRAEYRSYNDRGIEQNPQAHEGVQLREKNERSETVKELTTSLTPHVLQRVAHNMKLFRKKFKQDPDTLPTRHTVGALGDAWLDAQRTLTQETGRQRVRGRLSRYALAERRRQNQAGEQRADGAARQSEPDRALM